MDQWQGGNRDTDLERNKNALLLPSIGSIVESAQDEELIKYASNFVYFTQRKNDKAAEKLYEKLQDENVEYETKLFILRGLTESGLPEKQKE